MFLGFNIEWKSIEADTTAFFEATRYADYRLYSDTGFSREEMQALRDCPGIDAAARFLSVNAEIEGSKKAAALMVSENDTVTAMLVTSGEIVGLVKSSEMMI